MLNEEKTMLNQEKIFAFAEQVYGGSLHAAFAEGESDAYSFQVGSDGALSVQREK